MKFEERYHEDGVDGWFYAIVTPIPDGIAIATQIITERKQAEDNLERGKALYRAIAKHLPNAVVYVFGQDLRFLIVEGQGLTLPFGFADKKSLEGKTVRDLDKQTREIVESRYRRVLAGESFHYETFYHDRIVRTDYVPIFDEEGKVVLGMAIPIDITDQKKAEEALRESEERQAFLLKLSDALGAGEDADQTLYIATRMLAEHLRASRVQYFVAEGDSEAKDACGIIKASYGREIPPMTGRYRMADFGIEPTDSMRAKITVVPNVFDDKKLSEEEIASYKAVSLGAWLSVPLIRQGRFVAALVIHQKEVRDWAPEEIELARETAERTWAAVERSKAEEALRESEEKYRHIVETAQEGIWLIDQNDSTVFVNQKMSDMLGFSIDEILGQSPQKFMAPEFRIKAEDRLIEHMQGTKHVIDYRFIRKDGSNLWCILSSTPLFDHQGKYSGSLSMITDITERKRAEEALQESEAKYRGLFDSMAEAFELMELVYENGKPIDYIFLDVNPAWERMTGLKKEQVLGRKASEAVGSVESYWPEAMDRALRTGETVHIENYGIALDKWYSVSMWKFSETSCGVTITDITDSKKAEEALRIVNETLEERVQERTSELEQAYNSLKKIETIRKKEIHHRIKNNLQVISSLLDLQAEKFNNKECIKDSEVLEAFKESQNRVISMALIHEELHRGGEIDSLNFSQYIEELADNLFLTYRSGSGGIILDMDIEENIFFDMDTSIPLGMIINELVSNSLKHAFSGSEKGEIKIKLHREENKECIENISEDCKSTKFAITISDNGVGILEELDIEDIDSLGFQLIISLVDQLDGEFELKRSNGTEFTMKFTVTEKDDLTQVDLKPQEFSN